jgi:O-antigen chain-terminating methyltransferase
MPETDREEISAEAVIAKIRASLRQGGLAADESSPYEEEVAPVSPQDHSPLVSEIMRNRVSLLRHYQDPRPQGSVASYGSSVIGPAKRFIRRVLAPYHRGIFARQAEFNANLVGLMAELIQALEKSRVSHDATLGEVHARLETLHAEQAAHAQRTAQQAEALATLTARLETLHAEQAAHAQRTAQQAEALATLHAEHGRITAHIERQTAELANRLAGQHLASEDLATKHVGLGKRLEEQRQEMVLQKRRLDLILSELRKKIGGKRAPLAKVASQKERLMDHSYFLFENRHRGSQEDIKKRQEVYLPIFKERAVPTPSTGRTPPRVVVDIGCGRGEFLELLREHGIPGKGIDLNEDMVHFCRQRGLDVEQASALAYLERRQGNSLGGVIACQVIEHLPTDEMVELIKLCYDKLEKGGRAVFETVNPLSLVVSATNFYLDLSHVRQIHPIALQFLAEAIGFINTEIRYLAPYPDELKLQLLHNEDPNVEKLNQNFARLNEILFGYQDYAVICEK